MTGLPVITLAPACPFSNTHEIHLLVCYKTAYRTRRQLMHNRRLILLSITPEKWDEQVFRIGETVSHEEAIAPPYC
jgi:hypothetical protein